VIDAMPRPRPPHLHRETSRHGKTVWYVRIGKGSRLRLHAEFGTPDFDAEYQAAITGRPRPKKGAPAAGTLAWLIERYRETADWSTNSSATRKQRENIFRHVVASAGQQPFTKITSETIVAGRDRRAHTPHQARHFLDAMRGLFRWAVKTRHAKYDPTSGVENPPRKKGDGFTPWTEEHVAIYQRRWPLGTKERVWLDVLLYSGLRRGDAVRYGRQHVHNGIGRIKTEKSGFTVTAVVPLLPVLAETLAAGPCGDLTFIVGERGQPLTKESFGNAFRDACRAAGVPGSAHGVRKIAATTAANNGATTSQLKALFGWTTDSMPALYTKNADRERLGREAGHMLANDERTSIPAPHHPVRAPGQKR
jgi:integrase